MPRRCSPSATCIWKISGTWRDADGRLVWGVNDFDEAAVMPYPLDLVRLAASIRLAGLKVSHQAAAAALLKGYNAGLAQPQPALLGEGETWLRPYAADTEERSRKFWKKVADYPKAIPPRTIADALIASLPKDAEIICFSLARRRDWQPRPAALRCGRLLARRPCTARSQSAGAVGVDLGQWRTIQSIAFPCLGERQIPGARSVPRYARQIHLAAHRRRFPQNRTR